MLRMECLVCFLLCVNVGLSGLVYVYGAQLYFLVDELFVQAHLRVFLIDDFQCQEKRLEVGIVYFGHMDSCALLDLYKIDIVFVSHTMVVGTHIDYMDHMDCRDT